MLAQNSDSTCSGRYCPSNTALQSEVLKSNPSNTVDVHIVKPKEVAPKKMDISMLPKDWEVRRNLGKDLEAKKEKRGIPVYKEDLKVHAANPQLSQIQLIIIIKEFRRIGIQYRMLSEYFERALGEVDMGRQHDAIARSILIKDRYDLKDSEACYAQVLADIEQTRSINFEAIGEAISDLTKTLKLHSH